MADFPGTPGDDILTGTGDADTFFFSLGNDTLDGGGGSDTLEAGEGSPALPTGTVVDLELGTITAPGIVQNISNIESVSALGNSDITLLGDNLDNSLGFINVRGSTVLDGRGGDDILSAEVGSATLLGGTGNDRFLVQDPSATQVSVEGGSGTDTLFVNFQEADVTVTFNAQSQPVLGWGGTRVTLLDEIEFFEFFNGATRTYAEFIATPVTGTEAGEVITGGPTNDILNALGGNDWILATTGTDSTDGGDGTDMISFVGQSKVVINLGTGRIELGNPSQGPVEIQSVTGVENITGTSQNDHLGGDEGANYIRGLGGRDIFIGSAGGDLLNGGAGNDFLLPNDFLPDVDSNISLLRGRIWEGEGAGSRLVSIENITSGTGNDRLTGDHGANRLDGGAGDDILMGNGGNDLVYGGFGDDIAVYSFDQDQYTVTTTEDGVTEVAYIGAGTGDGTDRLLSIETLRFADADVIL